MILNVLSNPIIACFISMCNSPSLGVWESGRCKTMLSPPSICWWPSELRLKWAELVGLQQNTPYIGDGRSGPGILTFNTWEILTVLVMGIQTPLLGWWPSTPTHPLSNLARRHAMASSRESCQPNLWHRKSSIGTKWNKSTMGLSGTEKKTWASVSSQAPMCCGCRNTV